MTEKPIVAMRALNYTWAESVQQGDHGLAVEVRNNWRLEIRREGETTWTQLEVIEIHEPPPEHRQ